MSYKHQLLFSLLLLCSTAALLSMYPAYPKHMPYEPIKTAPLYLPEYRIPYKTTPSVFPDEDLIEEVEILFERPLAQEQNDDDYESSLTNDLNNKEYISIVFLSKVNSDIRPTAQMIKDAMQQDGWKHKFARHRIFAENYESEHVKHIQQILNVIKKSKKDL